MNHEIFKNHGLRGVQVGTGLVAHGLGEHGEAVSSDAQHVAAGQLDEFLDEIELDEEQEKAQAFLSKAFAAALFLIMLILVTQFNSVSQPLIILTSVILSLGGVFLGLSFMGFSFGIVMSGVGVISLAGVVVNNAIVLIDYTNRLHSRGMRFKEAIISAGCTRLRPVLLTAITTILGLLPMVTGVAFNFHEMGISWVSESTQWWSSMASAVIFGLALATILTLIVVPTLYALIHTTTLSLSRGVKGIHRLYWAPFYRLTGSKPEEE